MLVFSLSGCTIKFFYEQIDWLVPWYIDRHLDLSASQKDQLKKAVSSQLHWHRQTQISSYIHTLTGWQAFFNTPFSRDKFDALNLETQNHLVELTDHVLPDVNGFLYSLTPRQRIVVYRLIEDNNQKYYDKYVSSGVDLEEVHIKESAESARFWLGSITKEQSRQIAVQVAKYRITEPETFANRQRWLFRLKEILELSASKEEKQAKLRQLFLSPRDDWSDQYQESFYFNADLAVRLMEEVFSLISARQKTHLLQRLKGWEKEFQVIAKRGGS